MIFRAVEVKLLKEQNEAYLLDQLKSLRKELTEAADLALIRQKDLLQKDFEKTLADENNKAATQLYVF